MRWKARIDTAVTFGMAAICLGCGGSSQVARGGPNLVANGNFAEGNSGFTSAYGYVPFSSTAPGNGLPSVGQYTVGPTVPNRAYTDWYPQGPAPGSENVLTVNGSTSSSTGPFWSETLPVTPNTTYTFSYYGTEVSQPSAAAVNLLANGTVIGSDMMPAQNTAHSDPDTWKLFTHTWSSGANTTVELSMVDTSTVYAGNDFALGTINFQANH